MQGKHCLSHEPATHRLFKEGRTEIVRTVTRESSNFVKALVQGDRTVCILALFMCLFFDIFFYSALFKCTFQSKKRITIVICTCMLRKEVVVKITGFFLISETFNLLCFECFSSVLLVDWWYNISNRLMNMSRNIVKICDYIVMFTIHFGKGVAAFGFLFFNCHLIQRI